MIKKLLIGASALALATGVANAQAVFGKKDGPTVNSEIASAPNPSGSSNYSDVQQKASDNQATVDQTGGARNSSRITQGNNAATSGNNRADVDQDGPGGNNVKIVQKSAPENPGNLSFRSDLTPSADLGGKNQRAIVTQRNTLNSGSATTRNDAVIYQGNDQAGGLRNYANVDQNGFGNDAGIQQGALATGYGSEEDGRMKATISQTGSYNTAETAQGEIDTSTTVQVGSNNET